MKKSILLLSAFAILLTLSGCFGAKQASVAGRGGEVVGVSDRSFVEPAPYGMVKINRGLLKMGTLGNENTTQGCVGGWILDG